MRLTIDAYKALYCSSVAFGMRKSLQTEQGKSDLQKQVDTLKEEKLELDGQIFELRQKYEQADRRAAEMREAETKKHNEEIAFLKKTNQQLKVNEFCSFLKVKFQSISRANWKELLRQRNKLPLYLFYLTFF